VDGYHHPKANSVGMDGAIRLELDYVLQKHDIEELKVVFLRDGNPELLFVLIFSCDIENHTYCNM
jgi:hypothetical protein